MCTRGITIFTVGIENVTGAEALTVDSGAAATGVLCPRSEGAAEVADASTDATWAGAGAGAGAATGAGGPRLVDAA